MSTAFPAPARHHRPLVKKTWMHPDNKYLRRYPRIPRYPRKGSMTSQRHFASQRHCPHMVIPAKETVSYRFITFELARRLSTRCPRASWLIAKSNHRQARRSLQDAYVDQRRLCVIPSLWLPIPFLRWQMAAMNPATPPRRLTIRVRLKHVASIEASARTPS